MSIHGFWSKIRFRQPQHRENSTGEWPELPDFDIYGELFDNRERLAAGSDIPGAGSGRATRPRIRCLGERSPEFSLRPRGEHSSDRTPSAVNRAFSISGAPVRSERPTRGQLPLHASACMLDLDGAP